MQEFLIRPDNMPSGTVNAFFTTRQVPDDTNVLASYAGVAPRNVYLPIQKHTDIVQIVIADLTPHIADAVITNQTGLLIGVKTADCVPMLLFDAKRRVVGAVHAGWRSTASEILRKTLTVFFERFYANPADVRVAIGPAICGGCYEVGPEVVDTIVRVTGPGEYVTRHGAKNHIDLRTANRLQAISSGVPADNIWQTKDCTCCRPEKYYSYRHTKGTTGRLYGMIALHQ